MLFSLGGVAEPRSEASRGVAITFIRPSLDFSESSASSDGVSDLVSGITSSLVVLVPSSSLLLSLIVWGSWPATSEDVLAGMACSSEAGVMLTDGACESPLVVGTGFRGAVLGFGTAATGARRSIVFARASWDKVGCIKLLFVGSLAFGFTVALFADASCLRTTLGTGGLEPIASGGVGTEACRIAGVEAELSMRRIAFSASGFWTSEMGTLRATTEVVLGRTSSTTGWRRLAELLGTGTGRPRSAAPGLGMGIAGRTVADIETTRFLSVTDVDRTITGCREGCMASGSRGGPIAPFALLGGGCPSVSPGAPTSGATAGEEAERA